MTQEPPTTGSDRLDKRVFLIAGVVVLGSIMSILDITVVSVAQQSFQQEFDASAAETAWTMTGYTLALAAVIPLTGWAADRFGTKRLYLIAIVLFALGSALCALAQDLPQLVAFRVLQGLGGGMLMPLGMTILTRAAGPDRVGRVMAVLGIPMLLGPIFGPILGGWLIDIASWHWIFLINLPIGVVALIYAWLALPKDEVHPSESFDFVGMILLSPGLALLLYGISMIPENGTFFTPESWVPSLIGAVLVLAFVPWALSSKNDHPLIELRLFENKELTVAVLTMGLFAMAFFGASLLFPQYFQLVRGEDALHAGLLLAPQGLGAMLTMPIGGMLADKIGPGKVVLPGITTIVIGMGMFATLDDTTPYWFLMLSLFVMGMGMGCTMMPTFSAALSTLRDHTIARGSTLMNIIQQVAASVGTAIFTVLLTNGFKDSPSIGTVQGITEALGNPDDVQAYAQQNPEQFAQVLQQFGVSPDEFMQLAGSVLPDMADVFASTFVVAAAMVACCLIPAFFLPRSKKEHGAAAPTVLH